MEVINTIKLILDTSLKNGSKITIADTKLIVRTLKPISEKPSVIELLLAVLEKCNPEQETNIKLSLRQEQVLHLVGLGYKTKDIAKKLDISSETVSTHRKNIIKKLKISGSGQLTNFAFRYVNKSTITAS